jgi:hypothetical protein
MGEILAKDLEGTGFTFTRTLIPRSNYFIVQIMLRLQDWVCRPIRSLLPKWIVNQIIIN